MSGHFELRPLRTDEELRACVALQKETWGERFTELIPATLLRAAQRAGGVAAGAFDPAGRLGGFVFGLTGFEDGRRVHWSDMLAVREALRNQGVGERLKRYQRELLLPFGVETVYWSFDPLESRNAYLNFARLGATAREYCRDLYGDSDSPLHRGIGTDRLIAAWRIGSTRVRRRLAGHDRPPGPQELAALPLCNETRSGPAGITSAEPDLSLEAPRIRLAVPAGIQELKARAPALAAEWRQKTRAAFEAFLGRGYEAVEVVREGERSCYVLERVERTPFT